jgi:hypothetical protein
LNLGNGGVLKEVGEQVAHDVAGGGDVRLGEREECAFVFLVADYERDAGVLVVSDEDIG